MNLFIRDIPIHLYPSSKGLIKAKYDDIIEADNQEIIRLKDVRTTWVKNATHEAIKNVLEDIYTKKIPSKVSAVIISTRNYEAAKNIVQGQFDTIVAAAGGVVRKENKLLLIYRLKKWDLPKGKKEAGETFVRTAIREIKEECNISITPEKKICTTWHSYESGGDRVLKQTQWYEAISVDDTRMKPCSEEGIEEIRWMSQKEINRALNNSYRSIRFVLGQYYEKIKHMPSPF